MVRGAVAVRGREVSQEQASQAASRPKGRGTVPRREMQLTSAALRRHEQHHKRPPVESRLCQNMRCQFTPEVLALMEARLKNYDSAGQPTPSMRAKHTEDREERKKAAASAPKPQSSTLTSPTKKMSSLAAARLAGVSLERVHGDNPESQGFNIWAAISSMPSYVASGDEATFREIYGMSFEQASRVSKILYGD